MSRTKVILQTLLMLAMMVVGIAVGWKFGPRLAAAAGIALPPAMSDGGHPESHAGHDHGPGEHEEDGHDHGDGGHDHAGHAHGGASPTTSHDKHVPLSREAVRNIGLRIGPVPLRDHQKFVSIPGSIISKPTRGHRIIAAPFSGVVREVAVTRGTAVEPTSRLFEIEITDEELLATQTRVLDTMAKLRTLLAEIKRLEPLVQDQIVGGSKLRAANYERDQLLSTLGSLQQSLNSYGFGSDEFSVLAKDKELVRNVSVFATPRKEQEDATERKKDPMPSRIEPLPVPPQSTTRPIRLGNVEPAANRIVPVAYENESSEKPVEPVANLPVERIHVQVGATVRRGESLCTLGNYADLLVEGKAFNKDMTLLSRLVTDESRVMVKFGHQSSGDHRHDHVRDNLEILYIDGEIDAKEQTVKFYVKLDNEILHRKTASDGSEYLTWLFRPGQNVHVQLPEKTWEDRMRVPREAVVIQGPNAFVFRRLGGVTTIGSEEDSATAFLDLPEEDHDGADHDAAHDDHDGHDHDGVGDDMDHHGHDHAEGYGDGNGDDEIYVELEPILVEIEYQDQEFVILGSGGKIKPGDIIALNNAYQLWLASQMDTSGGGGHGHEH